MSKDGLRVLVATAPSPGAIGVIQLHGDVGSLLVAATGIDSWPVGRVSLARIAGIDDGLVARLTPECAQIMPHGGPRVRQRLTRWLVEHGAVERDASIEDPCDLYPEAADRIEALMLVTLARAASPLALDLLLDQPRRWHDVTAITAEDRARAKRLHRLIEPPLVVLAGPPNVGKSTLSNALLGRAMSITADLPGTTRDYTSGRIELAGLVVDWYDTPGLRATGDPLEREAQEIASLLIERADCLVAMRDHLQGWPTLKRAPDFRVINKIDLASGSRGATDHGVYGISALRGDGVERLVRAVRDTLVSPADLAHPGPWLFDARLAAL